VTLEPGTKIEHYVILFPLGAGGMGEVYLAEDARLHRKLALKLLSAEFTQDETRVRRFQQEARAASALNHPNIITIFEIGQSEGRHFIATEYIDGQTLRDRMNSDPLRLREGINIAIQVARALAMAHDNGIIHRDIKPENVMLRTDGYVKTLDFGLAKLTEKSGELYLSSSDPDAITKSLVKTDPGIVMGTVSYMSPEQARGAKVDARTDIFSLGILLYEMIAGRKPFEGATISDVIALILYKDPPPLARYSPEVPTELERIAHKALAKDREERYQTAKDLAIDLRRLRQHLDVEAELERSRPLGSFKDALTRTTSGDQKTVLPSNDRVTTIMDSGAASEAPRSTSSAEYIVTEIKRHKKSAAFIAAMLAVAIASVVYFTAASRHHAIDSLAVLPFLNYGGDANTESLTDGFTEGVISSLSRVPSLRVMSFSSVFRFKGQSLNPQSVGNDLRVHAVLTGRISQRNDTLTVNVELVDALDNSHLWGKQYSHKFSEALLLQEEISKDVSEKLDLSLSGEQKKRFESYQLYLKGRSYWNKRTTEALKIASNYFQQAIDQNPNFAAAHAGLADCYNMLALYSALQPKEGFPKAKAAAMRALELDDSLAEAHAALAFVNFRYDWNWVEAGKGFNRAIELNANYAPAHQWYANYLIAMGRMSQAIEEARRTQDLDPFSLVISSHKAWALYFAGQYDQAIAICKKTLELDPNFFVARRYLGLAYEQKGMYAEAISEYQQALALSGGSTLMIAHLGHAYAASGDKIRAQQSLTELEERSKQGYVSAYLTAVIYAGLGEKEKAFEWLEKAYEERAEFLIYLKTDPRLEPLRSDPRFIDLLRRIGLPQ
jgi:eukaryotic-like serine/threonine-protein kinase